MTTRLVILYEDSRGAIVRFPLHDLVVRSAADLAGVAFYEVARRVRDVPKGGDTKVLSDLANNSSLFKQHTRVLAWIDNDRIREKLKLPKDASRSLVITQIKARGPKPAHGRPAPLEVFLLDDNLEDLIEALADHLDRTQLAKARNKKKPESRDILLDEIASSPALRATLRARHAGFDCVSRFVACIATTEPWPP